MQEHGANEDQLNEALDRAEEVLEAKNWGVSASVPMGDSGVLCFKKRGAEWKLLVLKPDGDEVLLRTTSRKTRVEAARALPSLRAALLESRDKTQTDVITAVREVTAFCDETEQTEWT